ncbi:MAG: M20/M25/M40 family metallo-hydrolase [Pyrinomonadaceae bacterium]|nr:M20/M25/M40 family metallo-hydrolase [Pyrinomonadaceae bacterium]
MKNILRAFSFALLLAVSASAQLLSVEKKIAETVDANNGSAIALLEKTVNIESPTENVAGVKEVGMIFKKELDALGFQTKWLELPAEMKRAGHLIAEKKGGKGKTVLLLGHLDTVLSGEKFRREGNMAYGTGTSDMKGGNIVLLYALKALNSADALKDANIIVFLTGDEENAAEPVEVARREMVEAAKRSDLVLSFENGGNGIATVARRGISDWTLEVTAKTGHSSAIFKEEMGSGAIFEASRILNQFYEQLRGEKYLTFNPGLFVGGTTADAPDHNGKASGKTNVVAAKAIVRGDIRFISKAQEEAAREKMRGIVSKNLSGTSAKINFFDGIPAMAPTDANYELLKKLDRVSQDLNLGNIAPLDPGERGAGDISFVTHLIPGLDGLGATGGKAHAAGEFVDLESLPPQTKRAALLIYRLTR